MARTNDGSIDPRQGAAKKLTPPANHPGTGTIINGVPLAGISRTQSNEILQGRQLGEVHGGGEIGGGGALAKAGHVPQPAPVHDGMTDSQKMDAADHLTVGNKVLAQGRQGVGEDCAGIPQSRKP